MEKLNKKQEVEGSSYHLTLIYFIAKRNNVFPEKSNAGDLIHPAESLNKVP